MISVYLILSAALFFNLALALVFVLRRSTHFLVHYSVSVLVLLAFLSLVRLLLPIHLPDPLVLHSQIVLPAVEDFLERPVFPALPWTKPGLILLAVWAAGTAAFIVRDSIRTGKAYKVQRALPAIDAPQMQALAASLGIRASVIVSPDVSVPFAAGLFRPKICFPDTPLSEQDRRFILLHEDRHIRGGDAWIKLFFLLLRDLFWWNPLSHLFLRELDALLELRCDAAVTQDMDEDEVLRYLAVILAFSESAVSPRAASALTGAPNALRQRFEVLLQLRKRRSFSARAALCALALFGFLASYAVVVQPYVRPEDAALFESGSYIVKMDSNRYVLYFGGLPTGYMLDKAQLSEPPFDRMTVLEDRKLRRETPPEQISDSEETGWYFRQMDGRLEMRLWSFTYRIWRGDWQTVADVFAP